MSFSEQLKAKIGEASLAEVATAMGVALPGLRKAISGKSLPNARSLGKYAAFLGISEGEAKTLIASAKSTSPVKARAAKGPAKAKGKGGRKAKAAKTDAQDATEPKAAKGKRGRKAGAKVKATKGSGLSSSLSLIADAIGKAEAILADPLVNQLYSLTGPKRKAAEAILASVL